MKSIFKLLIFNFVVCGGVFFSLNAFAYDFDEFLGPEEHDDWKKYMRANRYTCPGPLDSLKDARRLTIGGKEYLHTGHKLELDTKFADKDSQVKIGIVSAIKDPTPGTIRNLRESLEWFEQERVDWIVVNGDIASGEFDMEEIVDLLLAKQIPLLINLGNLDSKGSWARVYKARHEENPHLINGVWIRQIITDDVEFWVVPGYHDPAFVHQDGGCKYTKEDVDVFRKGVEPDGDVPIVLIAHGPPKGEGRHAIDRIHDKKNVGDKSLAHLIRRKKIKFGIFGHILESGGRAVKSNMRTRVRPGTHSNQLHLNVGSVSADPWGLHDGSTSYGMSMIFSINKGKAKFKVKKFSYSYEE